MRIVHAAVLDCRRVDALRLRFQNRERDDLVLTPGVHAIGAYSGVGNVIAILLFLVTTVGTAIASLRHPKGMP